MPLLLQNIHYAGLNRVLYIEKPGEQLVVHACMLDCLADVHAPIDIQDGLDDRTEYPGAACAAEDKEGCTVLVSDDCG
jgi:hypothetical protein